MNAATLLALAAQAKTLGPTVGLVGLAVYQLLYSQDVPSAVVTLAAAFGLKTLQSVHATVNAPPPAPPAS